VPPPAEAPSAGTEPSPPPLPGATPEVAAPLEPAPGEGIDPTLLDAPEPTPEPTRPVATRSTGSRSEDLSPEEQSEAIDAAYAAKYRPADNPVRLNITGRVQFANVSGRERVNGRIGGASVDVGPAWNRFAVAATLSGWGGRIQLPQDTGAEMNAMFGGGLSVGLGRLALMTHGYVDLRLGYDIYYGVVNQRSDSPAILAPQADPDFVAVAAENILPHGPRVRLDMGLVGAGHRRYFHGFGLSMGYQALVGSIGGGLPPTSMLTVGFSYWMG